jgi:hypothetical protein
VTLRATDILSGSSVDENQTTIATYQCNSVSQAARLSLIISFVGLLSFYLVKGVIDHVRKLTVTQAVNPPH